MGGVSLEVNGKIVGLGNMFNESSKGNLPRAGLAGCQCIRWRSEGFPPLAIAGLGSCSCGVLEPRMPR